MTGVQTCALPISEAEREARAASALEHPNICPIYEFGEHEGQPFMVMPLLEGQTLKEWIARPLTPDPSPQGRGERKEESGFHSPQGRGWCPDVVGAGEGARGAALPINTLLDLAAQIADGLDAAHSKGIIHRDLKPANVFITVRGEAKILDFGLAKMRGPGVGVPGSGDSAAAIDRQQLTRSGTAMGTVAYMSPEQARGEKLDARTDLFSFGAVLYEMATGRQAFSGSASAVIFDAILNGAPASPIGLNPSLPLKLEEIIHRLLEKDRGLRYQSAADLRSELKQLKSDSDSARSAASAVPAGRGGSPPTGSVVSPGGIRTPIPAPSILATSRTRRSRIAIGLAVLVAAGALAFLLRPTLPPPKVTDSTQVTNDGRAKDGIATDGSRIYFSSCSGYGCALYQASAAGGETLPMQTSITNPVVADISPDRSELLVASSVLNKWAECPLFILPVLGRPPRRIGNVVASWESAAWSRDGKEVVYGQGNTLYRAKIDGTESRELVSVATGATPYWPRWSPDGSRLRFSVKNQSNSTSLWEVSAEGKNLHPLLSGWNNPPAECCGNWTPDGKYFFFQSQRGRFANIWAIREGESLFRKVSHKPVQLTTGPMSTYRSLPSTDGKKVFVVTAQTRGELARYDSASHRFMPYLSGISAIAVSFSRDGKWVAYAAYPEGTLWRSKIDGSERLQLTLPPLFVLLPRWSPDGTRIAFMGQQPGKPWTVYVIPAEGGSSQQPVPGDHRGADPNWSPDGNSLLLGHHPDDELPGSNKLDLEILDLRTHAISKVPGSQELWSPRWSPDGRYILAFPRAGDRLMLFDVKTRTWSESAKIGVAYPEWSRQGDYIYFLAVLPGGKPGGIFRVRISDRKLEQLVSLEDFRQAPYWGSWAGLAPDDSPLLLRDAGTQDIYALDWQAP